MTDILKNTKSFASLQNRQEKFRRRATYGMINGSRKKNFRQMKKPQRSRKIENGGNVRATSPDGRLLWMWIY